MAHAQKPDFVFPRNGLVHLNRWGRQFSRLLAVEVCALAWVMLDRLCSEVAWEYWLPTPFASFPFTSPPVRHRVPTGSERALLPCEFTLLSVTFTYSSPRHSARSPARRQKYNHRHLARMIACQQKTEIPYYAVLRFTTIFDIPPQIAVKDSGAIAGFDGTFKSRVQNKQHNIPRFTFTSQHNDGGKKAFAIFLTSTRLHGSKIWHKMYTPY